MTNASHSKLRIAVIGAGPVGLIAGRELLAHGFDNFTIFEKASAVGGTWHLHSYPGLACDVKAHSYVFTGAPNPDWSASFVEQPEIEAYLQSSAREFGLEPHLRLETEVTRAEYQGDGRWQIETAAGETEEFDLVINAMGNQHTAVFPDIAGRERFQGESWHATRWNHGVDLRGKRIALVGSAASAVQITPELAKVASELFVLQRTPNWVLPRNRKEYSPFQKKMFRYVPGAARFHRFTIDLLTSLSHNASRPGHKMMKTVQDIGLKNIENAIEDPALRAAVTPDSQFGCKRPLVSDDFYPALTQKHVTLLPTAAAEVTETGLVTTEGDRLEVDVIIYCTGYKILDFERIDVTGEEGRSLAEEMGKAPEAFKGVSVPGFPNYFLGTGPNGVLLSASFFTAAEINVASIVKLLCEMQKVGAKTIAVRPAAHREHNDWIASERGNYSWGQSSCNSYYRTPSGHTPFLFPGNLKTFKKQREETGLHEYEVR